MNALILRDETVMIDNDPTFSGRVREVYPYGSTSYAFPHVRVDVKGGDKNIAVHLNRVKPAPSTHR